MWRRAIAVVIAGVRLPGILERGDAAAVRRDRAEQLHHEQLEWRVGPAVRVVVVAAHGLLERHARVGIAAVLAEPRHDAEDRIAPLAEGDEIVEALEDHVLLAEMLAVAGVFQPVPGDRLLRIPRRAGWPRRRAARRSMLSGSSSSARTVI